MERIRRAPVDFIVTAALLVLGLAGLATALGFPAGARQWPIAIMAMLIAGTAAQLVFFFLGARPELSEDTRAAIERHAAEATDAPPASGEGARLLGSVGLIVLFLLAAPTVGLFTSAFLYLAAHMIFLGIRPLWLALLVAVGATLVIYGFFGVTLGVTIPNTFLP